MAITMYTHRGLYKTLQINLYIHAGLQKLVEPALVELGERMQILRRLLRIRKGAFIVLIVRFAESNASSHAPAIRLVHHFKCSVTFSSFSSMIPPWASDQ